MGVGGNEEGAIQTIMQRINIIILNYMHHPSGGALADGCGRGRQRGKPTCTSKGRKARAEKDEP
jgi:hypothetical protein